MDVKFDRPIFQVVGAEEGAYSIGRFGKSSDLEMAVPVYTYLVFRGRAYAQGHRVSQPLSWKSDTKESSRFTATGSLSTSSLAADMVHVLPDFP